ncbi:hypothetical protein NM208_g11094 [Fusarium decemcellulare]|uniref:Uncharacterized protein n=1 Tax=Fusarium decemcellulare TaxID=57161 RepID=A0ACC1RVK1_9HYPO|nr:hypothetical protein NM208_g11094 [Fusarium decemcellulare]
MLRPPYDPIFDGPREAMSSTTLDIESVRKPSEIWTATAILARFPDLEHKEYVIKGPEDNEDGVVISVFAPKSRPETRLPAIYFVHSGGQVGLDRFCALDIAIGWMDDIQAVYVSVEYRLAPEYPAPAALNDSYHGLVWMADHADELGIDASRIVTMSGSGGAPIAAGSAMLARDRKYPKIHAQMLITPMLDDRVDTVSSRQYEDIGPWCGRVNRMAWDCVLGDRRGKPDVDPRLAPARATDLAGLPPTYIDASECEVFRDEAVAFASRLWESGVSAELHIWPGGFHGSDMAVPDAPVSRSSSTARTGWLRRMLEK